VFKPPADSHREGLTVLQFMYLVSTHGFNDQLPFLKKHLTKSLLHLVLSVYRYNFSKGHILYCKEPVSAPCERQTLKISSTFEHTNNTG